VKVTSDQAKRVIRDIRDIREEMRREW